MKTVNVTYKEIKILRTDREYLTYDGICIATKQLFKLVKHLESEGGKVQDFFWYQKRGNVRGYFIVKAERVRPA